MKELPDFNVNISQAINYIFESDLAVLAFENPPFINYVNIVRKTIETIDRLSENCNMPEFTNHGLRHICSLVKRASEWAVTDKWIKKIDSNEAGYLLMGILVHDLGMLSQEVADLPEDVALEYKRQNFELATWVRKTHVLRLGKLLHRIFRKYENNNPELIKNIDAIAQISASHNYWPWEKQFELEDSLVNYINISKERIKALNSVIAVIDLLDEDSERCDSETLIKHKKGNNINIAHWYRHALTKRVYPIKDHRVKIDMRAIEGMDETFEDVFKVIRNQFKVILIYKKYLDIIDAKIDKIDFYPDQGMPKVDIDTIGLGAWKENIELKNSMKELLISTFIPEARGKVENKKLYDELKAFELEDVENKKHNELLDGDKLLFNDEKLLYKLALEDQRDDDEILNYYRKYIEHEFLSGNIGRVKNLCCMLLEYLKCKDINKTYWILAFLIYLLDSEQDYMIIENNITEDGEYAYLINLVILALNLDKSKYIKLYEKLDEVDFNKFKDDVETRLLFSLLVEYSYMFEDNEIINYINKIINKFEDRCSLYGYLKRVFLRLRVQFALIFGKVEKEDIEWESFVLNDEEKMIGQIWGDFFESNAIDLDNNFKKFSKFINEESKYYKSFIDLIVITANIRGILHLKEGDNGEKKDKLEDNYTKHYRCLRLEFENQMNVLENRRFEKIQSLLSKDDIAAHNYKTIERLIVSGQINAMRNWDVASFIRFREFYAQYYEKIGQLCYEKNESSMYLCTSIVYRIQSLKSYDEKKYNHKFIGMIEVNEKNGIQVLYEFIFNNLAKVYWDTASEWLKALGDLMPNNQLDNWLKWVIKYKDNNRDHMIIMRLADLDFIEPIIKNYDFNSEQKASLEPILCDMCKHDYYWNIEPGLCEVALEKLSDESCKNVISYLTENFEDKYQFPSIYINQILHLSEKRRELIGFLKEELDRRYELTDNKDYIKYKNIVGKKYIKDFEKPNIIEISKEVTNILNEYTCKLNKGHHTFGDLSKVVELLSNTNWATCETKEVDNLLELIKEFSINNTDRLKEIEYHDIYLMLLGLYNGANNKSKIKILNATFEIYGDFEDAKGYLKIKKKRKTVVDIEDGKVLGFLRLICAEIQLCDDDKLVKVIEWCIEIINCINKQSMIYYCYIFSYTYIYRKLPVAYSSLQALQLIVKFNEETKDDYLYCILFGIKNFIYNMKNNHINSFEEVTKNEIYIKWLYNMLDAGSMSIYYEKREIVVDIIKNFEDTSYFNYILDRLKDEPRTSIVTKLNS